MRFSDRVRSSCAAVALAAICVMAIGATQANAARPQAAEARSTAGKSARPAPPVAIAKAAKSGKLHGVVAPNSRTGQAKGAKLAVAGTPTAQGWGGISCVPFVRAATGMEVKGNAHLWWDSAAGAYERGQRPEAGSVLNFRSTSRMRLGHVAVVARVVDSRTVEVDHSNWAGPGGGKGRVARGVPVIDVSPNNDWSSVQVGLAGGGLGSVYPTFGFIYDRADRGVMVANTLARPTNSRYSEVAEAWAPRATPIDAPARALR